MESLKHTQAQFFIRNCVTAYTRSQLQNALDKRPNSFWSVSNKDSSSKWCVYSKLNISCWLIVLTAIHLLLLLSHRSWHEENSVIEKSRAWSLFAHIWQMGHHRFKGEHLETGAMGGQRMRVALKVAVPLCTGDNKKVTLSKPWHIQ